MSSPINIVGKRKSPTLQDGSFIVVLVCMVSVSGVKNKRSERITLSILNGLFHQLGTN